MIADFNTAVDAIHSAQTNVLSTVVKEEAYRKPLQSFIDSGTDFIKSGAKTAFDIVDLISKESSYSKVVSKK